VSRRPIVAAMVILLIVLTASTARAHKPSDAYLTLETSRARVAVRWDIAIRDLDDALHLDGNADGHVTWGEVVERKPDVIEYATSRLSIRGDGQPCPLVLEDTSRLLATVRHSDGAYLALAMRAECGASPRVLDVGYRLLFDIDPLHRGLVRLVTPKGQRTFIFTPNANEQRFELGTNEQATSFFVAVKDGMRHIGEGVDHLLFLLALLLPAVLVRSSAGSPKWLAVTGWRPAVFDVLRIVTAFTIAHSLTLSLAALDIVRLPSRVVESAIALSVVIAALNNLVPVLKSDRWIAAFSLGLLHGFGFSAVLVDLGLPKTQLVGVLFGFNVGVEIGQAAVVAVFLPLAYAARRFPTYRRVALTGGSIAITALATVWLMERAFDIRIFPGLGA